MGNKKSTSAGVSNYLRYVDSMPITKMSFQKVEKDLIDKTEKTEEYNYLIWELDFQNIYENQYIIDQRDPEARNIQKEYFLALYNNSKTEENEGKKVNIYKVLIQLIPILNNNNRDKAKAFYRCFQNIHDGKINGFELKRDYFSNLYKFNLIIAPNSLIKYISEQDEKDSLRNYMEKIGTEHNVQKITNETLNLIGATENQLKEKNIIIEDIFLISNRIEYAFDLRKMLSEIWNRFRPDEE